MFHSPCQNDEGRSLRALYETQSRGFDSRWPGPGVENRARREDYDMDSEKLESPRCDSGQCRIEGQNISNF